MNKGLSSVIDASRWIAALMVAVSHVHHLVLANFSDVRQKNLLWKAFYFFGSFGTEAVIIFFVVSGYLVGGLTAERFLSRSPVGSPPTISGYFIQRFARIYTVLLPALCVGLVLDLAGYHFFDATQLYSNSSQYHTTSLDLNIAGSLDLTTFLGNVLMLENIRVPVLGSNGPLWSLAYEWWYYCIFAAVLGIAFRSGPKRWASIAFVVATLACLPAKLLVWMLIWLVGTATRFYIRSSLPRPEPRLAFGLFIVVLCICRMNHPGADNGVRPEALFHQFGREMSLALAFAFALIGFSQWEQPVPGHRTHAALAGFSYSLYLVHFPAMLFTIAVGAQVFGLPFVAQPSLSSYAWFVAVLVLLCAFAYFFSLLTEKQTSAIAATIRQLISGSRRAIGDQRR